MGKRLKPLTLAHWYMLEAFESPFVCRGKGHATLGDLVTAVWLCSRFVYPWPRIARDVRRFGRVRDMRLRLWGRRVNARRYQAEFAVFADYLDAYLQTPPRRNDDAGCLSYCPPALSVVAYLVRHGLPLDRVWAMPLAEARAYQVANEILDGSTAYRSEQVAAAGHVQVRPRDAS